MNRKMQRGALVVGVLAVLTVAGCRQRSSEPEGAAFVRLINAVPDAGGLDVSVDGRRVWKRSEFRSSTGYQAVASGTYPVKMDADGPGTTLLTGSLLFEKGRNYTLLALGQAEGGTPAQVQVLSDEKPEHLDPGKVSVRLINASPGSAPVDLVVNTIVGLKGVGFGRRSSPVALAGGEYDLQLASAGTEEILAGPVHLMLIPGKSYTLIAMGQVGSQSLSLEAYPDR